MTYLISAKCNGYKTRTYSGVTTGTTKNVYLVPLRKIYLTAQGDRTSIGPCTSSSLGIIAKVVSDDHSAIAYPNPGGTVRFATTAGSFNATTLQQTITAHTNANGEATVTLYGVHWSGTATVAATDDLTTPDYDYCTVDTYLCDWEKLASDITINAPSINIYMSVDPTIISRCGSMTSAITADVQVCSGAPPSGTPVSFTIPAGDPAIFFSESGVTVSPDGKTATTGTTTTGGYGRAVVHVTADSQHDFGTATITASTPSYAGNSTGITTVTVSQYNTNVQVSPDPQSIIGIGSSIITLTATDAQTNNPVDGLVLTIHTTSGDFGSSQTQVTRTTGANGQPAGQASVTLYMNSMTLPSANVMVSYNDGCNGTVSVSTMVAHRQPLWKDANGDDIAVGVNNSSPLVANLIPGDGRRSQ